MSYSPKIPPTEQKDFLPYLDDELVKIATVINDVQAGVHEVLYAQPSRVVVGMVVLADGTSWNPGSGEGLYRRTLAGAWKYIG